jgi:hypothetical protein
MTEAELVVIEKVISKLDIALVGKTTKEIMGVMVWQAREELSNLIKTNLGEAKNVQQESECGK